MKTTEQVRAGDVVGGVFVVVHLAHQATIAWLSGSGRVSHTERVSYTKLFALVEEFS